MSVLIPHYHPMVANPDPEKVRRLVATEEGRQKYAAWLNKRALLIKNAEDPEEGDPFVYGWNLPHWKKADRELKRLGRGQYVGGGKRATKSERAAWMVVRSAMRWPRSTIWCMQGNLTTSKAEQQALIWKYLPAQVKALNGKARHGWAKVTYTKDGGFANRVLVLPNQSAIHFLTYEMETRGFQGWKLGAALDPTTERRLMDPDDPEFAGDVNLGAWMDEDCTLDWLNTIDTRCTSHKASWLWTFSVLDGITPAVNKILDSARTLEHARAPLLSEEFRMVKDIPPGHMPQIQESVRMPRVSIVFFWTEWNPFGSNYEEVKNRLVGRPSAVIARDAYGYAEQTKNRAYPMFGARNIIPVEDLPEVGTNYQIVDLAGERCWSSIWVRIPPGTPKRMYVYRDWPDEPSYGEWAVPAPSSEQPDGVEGPAQRSLGYGWVEYKNEFVKQETHTISPGVVRDLQKLKQEGLDVDPNGKLTDRWRAVLKEANVRDPQAARWFWENLPHEGTEELTYVEPIAERFIDPRAGADAKHDDHGQTTPIDELAKVQKDPSTGRVLAPGLDYRAASGVSIITGMTALNDLIRWDDSQPYCLVMNETHFFVTEACSQVIGCMSVYTNRGGEKGGWKDFSDCLRYAATSGLEYVGDNDGRTTRRSGGY